MISFASLFVGFVIGIVNVELMASGGVDRVSLMLDGRPVAQLREPFRAPVDLGCDPAPHELVAVAYDAEGKELGRARQLINLPRPTAEASLVLEEGSSASGRIARLAWRSLERESPISIAVTFNGAPIAFADASRIELPPHEPAQVHFLRALLDFGNGVTASAELVVGGSRASRARTELSAVAVEVEPGSALPAAEGLAGWLETSGTSLEAVGVEDDGLDVVVVIEGSARDELLAMAKTLARERARWAADVAAAGRDPQGGRIRFERDPLLPDPDKRRSEPGAAVDLRHRFLLPVGKLAAQSAMSTNVFPTSRWETTGAEGVVVGALSLRRPSGSEGEERIADAVVVAGLSAAEAARKRGVVLLVGPHVRDGSLLAPEEASRFLSRAGVPIRVITLGARKNSEAKRWGAVRAVRGLEELRRAVEESVAALDRQRIVWVEGSHLPQDVEIGPLAKGIRLAR